jgi:hypothetical protein
MNYRPYEQNPLKIGFNGFKYRKHYLYNDEELHLAGAFLYEEKCNKDGYLDVRFGLESLVVSPAELVYFGEWLIKQFSPRVSYQVDDDFCLPNGELPYDHI